MRVSTSVTVISMVVLAAVAAGGWVSAQEPPAQPAPTAAPAAAPEAVAAPVAAPQPAAAAAPTLPTLFAEGLRVEMKGKTRYSGNVTMEFTVKGRPTTLISVDVIPKMADDDIAKDLLKEFTLAAGSDFKVKASGGEVTIKKANKKAPNISLKITSQSILGVSFLIDGI